MSKQLSAGAALEKVIRDDLPEHVEFDPREEALLNAAAQQLDDIAALEADIRARGHVVDGRTDERGGTLMATGIRKLHSKGCPGRDGGRCRCGAGWEAAVYSKRDGKKIRKSFASKAEAKTWRDDANAQLAKGGLRAPKPTTIREAWDEWYEGAKEGTIRVIPSSPPRSAPTRARCAERSFPSWGASGSPSFAAATCRSSPTGCSPEG